MSKQKYQLQPSNALPQDQVPISSGPVQDEVPSIPPLVPDTVPPEFESPEPLSDLIPITTKSASVTKSPVIAEEKILITEQSVLPLTSILKRPRTPSDTEYSAPRTPPHTSNSSSPFIEISSKSTDLVTSPSPPDKLQQQSASRIPSPQTRRPVLSLRPEENHTAAEIQHNGFHELVEVSFFKLKK